MPEQAQTQKALTLDALDAETLKQLVSEASKVPSEAKFILLLEKWYRQGPSYVDEQVYEVVYGEVEEVVLEEFDEGYPYRKGAKVAIIPKMVPTVILVERHNDTVSPEVHEKIVYVFTKDGWKKLRVQ